MWKELDVYRWRYNKVPSGGTDPYWCKSCIAVCREGLLVDTYWTSRYRQYERDWSYSHIISQDHCNYDLTFLGNLSDYKPCPEHASHYYADEDLLDMNHSNDPKGNMYVRIGAVRSVQKMRDQLEYRFNKATREAESQKCLAGEYRQKIEQLDRGEDPDSIWI